MHNEKQALLKNNNEKTYMIPKSNFVTFRGEVDLKQQQLN